MKSIMEKRRSFIVNVLYFALSAALLYFSVKYVLIWILPFFLGFCVALLLRPASRFLSTKLRFPYKLAAILLAVLFFAAVGTLLVLLGVRLIYTLESGIAELPDIYTQYIAPPINGIFNRLESFTMRLDPELAGVVQNMTDSFTNSVSSLITSFSSRVLGSLSSTLTSLPSFLLAVLLSIISSIFFAMDYSRIVGYLMEMLPAKIRAYIVHLKSLVRSIGIKYVKSYAILVSVTFVELAIGLMIFGVDNAITIAALIAFIDLLPVLGTGGVVIPWIVIEILQSNYTFATQLTVLYVIITVVRNILEPRLVGHQIGIHPLAMLMSMYVGLKIFGFVGIFVLPLILVIIKEYLEKKKAGDGALPPEGGEPVPAAEPHGAPGPPGAGAPEDI